MALALANLTVTGTTYLSMLMSVSPTTRGNGQVNLWDDNSGGPADQGAGSITEGSADFSGTLDGIGALIRIARWTNGNRFILNSSGDGLGDAFTGTTNMVTLVCEHTDGTIETIAMAQRRSGGGTWVDWWRGNGLTAAEWDLINGLTDGDELLLAIHTGTATYTVPSTGWNAKYNGATVTAGKYNGAAVTAAKYNGVAVL